LVAGLLKTDGKSDPLKMLKISLAIAAPVLAIALSFVRSLHANTHAQHVGQVRLGRGAGIIATVLMAAAAVAVAWTVRTILVDGPLTSAQWVKGEMLGLTVVDTCWIPVSAAAVALLSVLIAGLTVHKAETTEHRPSGFARLAAGLGTLTLGIACGLLLYLLVTLNPTAPAEAQAPTETLSGASYVVLACMLTLLVVGLAWCFYRAIKAGKNGDKQVAEL